MSQGRRDKSVKSKDTGILSPTCGHAHLLLQMRNAIKASRNGYVDEVLVKEGQIVSADQPLLRFW